MQKYIYKKYNKKYKRYFNYEKKVLSNILKKPYKIQHIGSTSIFGLGGKEIIDILVSVKKSEINKILKKLSKKYEYTGVGGSEQRYFLFRDIKSNNSIRRVHVHLTWIDSKEEENSLKFISNLRKDKKLISKYIKVKKSAVKIAKGDGAKYRELKKDFIEKVLKV